MHSSKAKGIQKKLIKSFILLIPFLWLVGISTVDVSRFLLFISALFLMHYLKNRRQLSFLNDVSPLSSKTLCIWIALSLLLGYLALVLRQHFLGHGLDFAIFAQVVFQFSEHQDFLSSLNRVGYRNFLSDHFSPILILPAMMTKLGFSEVVSLAFFQFLSLSIAIFSLIQMSKPKSAPIGFNPKSLLTGHSGVLAAFLFLIFPTVRHQISWGTQVEFLGLGLMSLGFLFYKKEKPFLSVFFFLLSISAKETYATIAASFSAFVFLEVFIERGSNSLKEIGRAHSLTLIAYFSLAATATGWFFFYVYGHEILFGRPYDHLVRISPLESLSDLPVLSEKLAFFMYLAVPAMVIHPGVLRRFQALIIPLPLLLIIILSGFENMWSWKAHYGLLPCYLFLMIAMYYSHSIKVSQFKNWAVIFLILGSFSLSNRRPTRDIIKAFQTEIFRPSDEMVAILEPEKAIIVSYGLVPNLLFLDREWIREDTDPEVLDRIGYALVDRRRISELHPSVKSMMKKCYEDKRIILFCRTKHGV